MRWLVVVQLFPAGALALDEVLSHVVLKLHLLAHFLEADAQLVLRNLEGKPDHGCSPPGAWRHL